MSNKSQFVDQLLVDKSLGLRACDLTYWPPTCDLLLNNLVQDLFCF